MHNNRLCTGTGCLLIAGEAATLDIIAGKVIAPPRGEVPAGLPLR